MTKSHNTIDRPNFDQALKLAEIIGDAGYDFDGAPLADIEDLIAKGWSDREIIRSYLVVASWCVIR